MRGSGGAHRPGRYPRSVPARPRPSSTAEPENAASRILTSATELFARQGLQTTLAEVAAHAGLGVATVYRRFTSKDDLIYEVYADHVRASEELARQAVEATDAWKGFVGFFEESIRILATDRGLRELMVGGHTRSLGWARGPSPDRLAELLGENNKTMGRHLTALVGRAQRAGRLRQDFVATDMMLLSVAVQATSALGGAEHPELYRRALGYVLDGLRPSRRTATPLPAPPLTPSDLPQVRAPREHA